MDQGAKEATDWEATHLKQGCQPKRPRTEKKGVGGIFACTRLENAKQKVIFLMDKFPSRKCKKVLELVFDQFHIFTFSPTDCNIFPVWEKSYQKVI